MITKAEIQSIRALADKRGRVEQGAFIAEGEKLAAEIETMTAEVAQAEKKASLLTVIGTKEENNDMNEMKKAASLGEHFVNTVKAATPGKRFDVGNLESYNKIKEEYEGITC